MGASELKKEKTTSSSFDNMPSTIQIDEIDRSASDPVSIPIVQKNFASPVKHLQRAKVPKLTTHDLMKHPSLVSDQLRFSESGLTYAEIDSSLPNPHEFMQALVQCDSEQNSRATSPTLKGPTATRNSDTQRVTRKLPPATSKVLLQH